MDKPTLYIAETNGNGDVEHVWVVSRQRGLARPFDPTLHSRYVDDRSAFSGARTADIKSWIAARGAEGGPRSSAPGNNN